MLGSKRRSGCALFAFFVLALGAWKVGRADALRPEITYSTSAVLPDPSGITGAPVVSFQGIDHGTFTTPLLYHFGQEIESPPPGYGVDAPLGQLIVAAPPAGTTTTYNHVPFDLTFTVNAVNGDAKSALPAHFEFNGFLNGTVDRDGASDLKAFVPVLSLVDGRFPDWVVGEFKANGATYRLTLPGSKTTFSPGLFTASTPFSGVFVAEAPVPEPASVGVFLALSAGLLCRSRRRISSRAGFGSGSFH